MNLITQAEASRIAGVSKAAISKLQKSEIYNFFVMDGKKQKINADHPQWKSYLDDKRVSNGLSVVENGSEGPAEKKAVKKSKSKSSTKQSKKKVVVKSKSKSSTKLLQNEHPKQKNALTGGYDPSLMIPTSPQQLKSLTDIQEKNINMRVKLSELIDIEMVVSILEVVARDIGSFRNLGRKVSTLICSKLDCVGMEKIVEAVIDPEVASIIKMIKKNMSKNIDVESYRG